MNQEITKQWYVSPATEILECEFRDLMIGTSPPPEPQKASLDYLKQLLEQ